MSKGKSSCQKNPENHLYVGESFSRLQEIFTSAEREEKRPLQYVLRHCYLLLEVGMVTHFASFLTFLLPRCGPCRAGACDCSSKPDFELFHQIYEILFVTFENVGFSQAP